jgi:hypothetical protein
MSRHKWVLNHTNSLGVIRVLNPARVWVINNPTARCQTWLRSISSSTNKGGSKLGFSPDDGFVAVHPHPRVLHLRLQVLSCVLARVTTGCFTHSGDKATRSSTLVQRGKGCSATPSWLYLPGCGACGRSGGRTVRRSFGEGG